MGKGPERAGPVAGLSYRESTEGESNRKRSQVGYLPLSGRMTQFIIGSIVGATAAFRNFEVAR